MAERATTLRAGAAGATITPDRPLLLEGYGNREKPATGTRDPLEARAVVFDDGATRAALVALDLCGIDPASVARIRALVEAETGIAPANVIVTYSHTHSAPYASTYLNVRPDEAYLRWLEETAARAVVAAAGAARPVRIGAGEGAVDFNVNRRHRLRRGDEVAMGFRANALGAVDRRVRVLRLDPAAYGPAPPGTLGDRHLPQADPVAVLFSYVCHPTVLGGANYRYSGDYPGAARRFVEAAYGGADRTPAVFLPGCFGNVRPHLLDGEGAFRQANDHELTVLGRWLGSEVVQVAERTESAPADSIAAGRRAVVLPYARVADEAEIRAALDTPRRYWAEAMRARLARDGALPAAETSEVAVLRLGRHWLIATPGETCLELGLSIERGMYEVGLADQARGDMVLTVGYANDYVAYLPSASMLTEGGYESTSWYEYLKCGPFAATIESALVNSAIELAAEVAGAIPR
jgi:hypothetical protein